MMEEELGDDLASPTAGRVERVPFPPGRSRPIDYVRLATTLLSDARRQFGILPALAVTAEAIAVPLLLIAIQSAVFAVASYLRLSEEVIIGVRGFGVSLALEQAAAIVFVAGFAAAGLSYFARTRINRLAVRYEAVCSRRAVEHFQERAKAGTLPTIKEAATIARGDARSCGAALRLLLLALPWAIALILILPLLLWIQWMWTTILGIATIIAALVLIRLNRRMVRNTDKFETLRDASSLELTAFLKTLSGRAPAGTHTSAEQWNATHEGYLDAFEQRLQVPVRTQTVTALLFAISLASIVPAIAFTTDPSQLNVILLVFYIILLRVGFSYMGRVATLLMAFNQQFPMVRRYMIKIAPAQTSTSPTPTTKQLQTREG